MSYDDFLAREWDKYCDEHDMPDEVLDMMAEDGLTEEEALKRYEAECADGKLEREIMEDEREEEARRDGDAIYW